jgi:hypothetical protein
MTRLPLKKWCSVGGLSIVSFPPHAEYAVLDSTLESLADEKIALIHSKPVHHSPSTDITLIDATGHALTARSALRRRVSDQEGVTLVEDPTDMQGLLSQLKRLTKSLTHTQWWLWWSPSDLVAQKVDDMEIVKCLRVIAKDFSETRFLAFVAQGVHTQRGHALLEYISSAYLEIEHFVDDRHSMHRWRVVKHPDLQLVGGEIEL